MEFRRLVFATDLSDVSFQAWPAAVTMAQKFGAELHVVCVLEEPYALAPYEQFGALLRALQELKPQLESRLRERVKDHPAGMVVKTAVVEASSPAHAIIDYAKKFAADLIVTTTHGRGGMSHLLLGSVTEKLLRMAPMPVLVIRAVEKAK